MGVSEGGKDEREIGMEGRREVGMREIEREGWYSRSEMMDVHSEQVRTSLTPFCSERSE